MNGQTVRTVYLVQFKFPARNWRDWDVFNSRTEALIERANRATSDKGRQWRVIERTEREVTEP